MHACRGDPRRQSTCDRRLEHLPTFGHNGWRQLDHGGRLKPGGLGVHGQALRGQQHQKVAKLPIGDVPARVVPTHAPHHRPRALVGSVKSQISKRLAHGIQFDATRAVQTGRAECLQNSGLLLVQVGLKLFPFELPLEAPEEVATVVGVAVVSSLLLHPAQELLGVVFRQLPLAHEVLEVSEVHFAVTVPVEFFKQLAALRFGVVEEVSHLVQALPVHEVDLTGLSVRFKTERKEAAKLG
mmetsp:Transcript_10006/g.36558  ORF Transcript_10006/g.36558 Transcript_10006/m.36558 type:complete len:240 (-) Transcript_10006:322-1041(-)